MVVCKCRKATRLYCFVHKAPVCGQCICFPEHQICVVNKYSDWVVDGEYDWPPQCSHCHTVLEEGSDSQTTRLGCLHLMHTSCLVSHIVFHLKLHQQIMCALHVLPQSRGLSLDLSLRRTSATAAATRQRRQQKLQRDLRVDRGSPKLSEGDSVQVDGPSPAGKQTLDFVNNTSPKGPGATTRKGAYHVDRQNSEMSYYADDEDGIHNKYTRRGSFRHKFLRFLLPFWSSALPTLPVTAPPRKEVAGDDAQGRLRRQRSRRMDPRKILLTIAIMACMATMGILYHRLAQNFGEEMPPHDELQ